MLHWDQMDYQNPEASQVQKRRQDCKFTIPPNNAHLAWAILRGRKTDSIIAIIIGLCIRTNIPFNREDGSIDHSTTTPRAANGTAAHKLGPKANQGAINAGLRALDRTGKPCRKWQKGGFRLKSFTGVVWEIPRWTAPPRITVESKTSTEGSASGSGDSSKENKDNSQVESEKSNNGIDVEMASSPAPQVAPSATPPITSVPAASTPRVTEPTSAVTASA